MVIFTQGDMFASHYDAIVNAVNCVGVMGKGLALTFKSKFPNNFAAYKTACSMHSLRPGGIFVSTDTGQIIINAATKDHWRNPSTFDWVCNSIHQIAAWLNSHPEVTTVAVPKLGCGLGGLNWNDIRPVMLDAFSTCSQTIYVFGEPAST